MTRKNQLLAQPDARNLLGRILEQPDLAAQVQELPSAVLGRLIAHVGLEDAGELIALASTQQLAHILDEDLWGSEEPGCEERFDARRLLVWLEVMLEAGEAFAAQRLTELPEDLVTLALHRCVLVLDLEELALRMQGADEVEARMLDKALESCMYEELGEYQVMSRTPDGWDTLLAVLLALDSDHHEYLSRVLERCCRMATETIEDNGGLYEVLTSGEMLEADLAGERDDTRAGRGYVAPAAASAFLKLARSEPHGGPAERDAVTKSYFRNLSRQPVQQPAPPRTRSRTAGLNRILAKEGMLRDVQAERLLPPASTASAPEPALAAAMRWLAEEDHAVFEQRSEELAFLTNVLVSGCSFQQRRLRPIEAVRAVVATCSLGLQLSAGTGRRRRWGAPAVGALLLKSPADRLFRATWNRIHQEVTDRAAKVCLSKLGHAAAHSREDRASFMRLASELNQAMRAGTPWRALGHLDMMAGTWDAMELDALSGLMDECPHLRGELGANRGARDEPRFVQSAEELEAIDGFLSRSSWPPGGTSG